MYIAFKQTVDSSLPSACFVDTSTDVLHSPQFPCYHPALAITTLLSVSLGYAGSSLELWRSNILTGVSRPDTHSKGSCVQSRQTTECHLRKHHFNLPWHCIKSNKLYIFHGWRSMKISIQIIGYPLIVHRVIIGYKVCHPSFWDWRHSVYVCQS